MSGKDFRLVGLIDHPPMNGICMKRCEALLESLGDQAFIKALE
jgi:hypothetical protein